MKKQNQGVYGEPGNTEKIRLDFIVITHVLIHSNKI